MFGKTSATFLEAIKHIRKEHASAITVVSAAARSFQSGISTKFSAIFMQAANIVAFSTVVSLFAGISMHDV